jgi:hypothetical protein
MQQMIHPLLAVTTVEDLTSLGAAGLIGAMWLWERRASSKREQQLDETHTRILADKVQLDALMDVVQQNTQAITRLLSAARVSKPATGAEERAVHRRGAE